MDSKHVSDPWRPDWALKTSGFPAGPEECFGPRGERLLWPAPVPAATGAPSGAGSQCAHVAAAGKVWSRSPAKGQPGEDGLRLCVLAGKLLFVFSGADILGYGRFLAVTSGAFGVDSTFGWPMY